MDRMVWHFLTKSLTKSVTRGLPTLCPPATHTHTHTHTHHLPALTPTSPPQQMVFNQKETYTCTEGEINEEQVLLVSPASLQRCQIGTYHCSFET